MELETRLVLVFTIIGLFALIPFIAATYDSTPIYQNSPSGMILGAIENQPNVTSPHTRNIISGPDSYVETIQTPHGEFTLSLKHDEIIHRLEGNGKIMTITERADMRSEVLSSSSYTLNITTTPLREIEELKTPTGTFRSVLEDGVFSNSTTCSNASYIENTLNSARDSMDDSRQEMEIIESGISLPGASVSGIYINEFLADPGVNGTEWVEIYNNRSYLVSLGNWVLDDSQGGSEPHVIPAGTNISSKGFAVFYANITELQLNNNGDSVRLFDNAGNLVDSVSYETSRPNIYLAMVPDGFPEWVNLTSPTPGASNG